MKLSSFGSRHALAFALALAGALAACGGDDNNMTGAGGSGGNPDAGRGGGGVAEASADRASDRAPGTGGAADSSAGGSGGGAPDAAEAAPGTGGSPEASPDVRPPDAAPDVARPPDAPPDVPVPDAAPDVRLDAAPDVAIDAGAPDAAPEAGPPEAGRDADAGPGPGSDASDATPAPEPTPEPTPEPVVEPLPEAGPVDAGSDAGTQLLYSFETPNDPLVADWRVDIDPANPTAVTQITGGAPGSTAGAIEFNGAIAETHSVYVEYVLDPPVGLGEGMTRSHPGFTGLRLQVRLRNALDGGTFDNLNNVELIILGGAASGFATCHGDSVNLADLSGGDWVPLTVANCSTDAGSSALLDLARIAVEVNMGANDAAAIPIVLDVDDVVLTR